MTQTAPGPGGQAESRPAPRRPPLAPLTVEESGTAARVALAAVGEGAMLTYCELAEPAKEQVLSWQAQDGRGQPVPRQARCVIYKPVVPDGAAHTTVVTVSLDDRAVTATVPVP